MSVVSKTLKFTGGALLGLGVGAVTAMLLAPQSGEVSREQIRGRIDEMLDAGRRAQQETEDGLHARWDATVHEGSKQGDADPNAKPLTKAEEAAQRTRDKEEAARKEAEKHLEKAHKELEKARTKL